MSHADFHAWLFEIGTGWLGWSEEQTLGARITSILAAYKGRLDLLRTIFGGKPAPADKPPVSGREVKGLLRTLKAAREGRAGPS